MAFDQTGFGSGTTVVVFRDELPWDSFAMDSVLLAQGLTTGSCDGCYHVYPSTEMQYIQLRPDTDIVVISNDQPQAFYDYYAASRETFERFVADGGTLRWCACDLGWNYGSIQSSGLTLPRSVGISYALSGRNIISETGFDILAGMPDTLAGNYASQVAFNNLPAGTIIYMDNTDGDPVLIGYQMGDGLVFISGQPLEYNYDRRDNYSIGDLLPGLICFLLGIPADSQLSGPLSAGAGIGDIKLAGKTGEVPESARGYFDIR